MHSQSQTAGLPSVYGKGHSLVRSQAAVLTVGWVLGVPVAVVLVVIPVAVVVVAGMVPNRIGGRADHVVHDHLAGVADLRSAAPASSGGSGMTEIMGTGQSCTTPLTLDAQEGHLAEQACKLCGIINAANVHTGCWC